MDASLGHCKIRHGDAHPLDALVAGISQGESGVASHRTPEGMLEAGEVCSGFTVFDDSCHEPNMTNLEMQYCGHLDSGRACR